MRLAWLCLLAACGDNSAPRDVPDGGDTAAPAVQVVATLPPEGIAAMALAALDEHRVAIASVTRSGDAFCPDCVDLDPSQCPALCRRADVTVSLLDTRTRALGTPQPVATVFPSTFDHSVDQVELVSLGGERLGIAWLDCDNSSCAALAAKRSCTARYTTLDLETGTTGDVHTLYSGWFGDLSLAFEPANRQLLALVGKDLAMGSGIFRALFDETGATVRSPWTALGSTAARSAAIVPLDGELLIVADDWSPSRPPLASPCEESCDCLGAGPIDAADSGLFAYRVGNGPDHRERVAAGIDEEGFYARREQIAVIAAGGRPMIAATQSIDRVAEIFVHDGTWTRKLATAAPIPLWIGALGTADHFAWLGAQVEPGAMATMQRLVAGIVANDASERTTLDAPLDRHVFTAAPVQTAAGVTRTYLLQGVFAATSGSNVGWDRFEVLVVEAAWPGL